MIEAEQSGDQKALMLKVRQGGDAVMAVKKGAHDALGVVDVGGEGGGEDVSRIQTEEADRDKFATSLGQLVADPDSSGYDLMSFIDDSRETMPGLVINLSNLDLREFCLKGMNLAGAILVGVNLAGVDLSSTDLRDADLTGADLAGADLRDTDLRGAKLRGAKLRGAKFVGAELAGADLAGADLRDTDDLSVAALAEVYDLTGARINRDQEELFGDALDEWAESRARDIMLSLRTEEDTETD